MSANPDQNAREPHSEQHDDFKQRLNDAVKVASESRAGHLLSIVKSYYPDLTSSGYLKVCPWCKKTGNKFAVRRAASGHWYWGCHHTSCEVSFDNLKSAKCGDAIGFITIRDGLTRADATRKFLEISGVPYPEPPKKTRKSTKPKPQPKPNTETPPKANTETPPEPAPSLQSEPPPEPQPQQLPTPHPPSSLPDAGVWNRIHELLALSSADRETLKRQRGFTRETIEAAGYRSSDKSNHQRLAPILSEFSPSILLSTGVARKAEDGSLKINSQLCGYGLLKRATSTSEEEWANTNPILIPYRDHEGNIHAIRPHKGGLSGKSFMRSHGFELGFRTTRVRSHLYTTWLFNNRPDDWKRRIVLTEGEFKADALAQAGIPACAVPGIQMPRNNIFFANLIQRLRHAGIIEVIVVFDNEDKTHKEDPWDRYDVEVYSRFTCHALRSAGFKSLEATIPDEWRIDGKADWDGALAQFGSAAPAKFKAVLKKTKPYFPQTELFGTNERDRVIHCKLNRLIHEPKILTGGEEEELTARLILKTHPDYRQRLNVRELASLLFETRGCYYVHRRPTRETLEGTKTSLGLLGEREGIKMRLAKTPAEDLEEISCLEAALAAADFAIKGYPEILTDFTISCDYQVRTQTGEIHRLFRFKNKYGQLSEYVTVPPSAISTSTKFREFAMGVGNFNPCIGDKQLQQLIQDIGTFSAWREIREIDRIGHDPESGLWIFGDCAFTRESQIIFADKYDIIWHDGIGYRIDPQDLAAFAHESPPKFFRHLGKTPREVLDEILANPDKELANTAHIFLQYTADMISTFGDNVGCLVVGCLLAYAIAPELLKKYQGHPGLWIHGRMQAGKTETARFIMMTWGYDSDYRTSTLSEGTTSVAIDRLLAQYSDIPLHLDEFRQDEVDRNRIASLRGAYNRQAKSKGRMDQTNRTRHVQPHTSPIVTGEGVTTDAATLSRYIEAILAADKRLGDKDQQTTRYHRMLQQCADYHHIVRHILMRRTTFSQDVLAELDGFINSKDALEIVPTDRLRLTYGSAYSTFITAFNYFTGHATRLAKQYPPPIQRADLALVSTNVNDLREFSLSYARKAAADVASINFMVKFWKDVMTSFGRNSSIRRFIKFEHCSIDAKNNVIITTATEPSPGIYPCILVRSNELYAEYETDSRSRGRNPELSLSNIRAELRNERYYVPAPENATTRAHRFQFNDEGRKTCWVLRHDLMDSTLQEVFFDAFQAQNDDENDAPPLNI